MYHSSSTRSSNNQLTKMNSLVAVCFFVTIAIASAAPGAAVIAAAAPGTYIARAAAAPLALAAPAPAPWAYAAPAPAAPLAYAAAPAPLLVAPAGSGLEGQYIPDNLESLYDDGSYKPWLYGF